MERQKGNTKAITKSVSDGSSELGHMEGLETEGKSQHCWGSWSPSWGPAPPTSTFGGRAVRGWRANLTGVALSSVPCFCWLLGDKVSVFFGDR